MPHACSGCIHPLKNQQKAAILFFVIANRKIVAFCTARIHDTLNYDLLTTLNKQLNGTDTSIFVYNICSDNFWSEKIEFTECAVYNLIDYDIVDAIIIMDEQIKSRYITESIIKKAREHGKPVILVNGKYEGVPSIGFDFKYGFEAITRHVIEHHKARDVIFIGGIPGNSFSDEREKIFRKVLKENGVPFKDGMITYGYFFAEATQDAVEKIILSGHIPEAIICANDVMAISAEQMIQKFDIDLAEKIIVTGFDGLDEIYFSTPQITSVKCNHITLAIELSVLTKKMLAGKKIAQKTLIKPELFIAASCGCVKETIPPPDYFSKLSNRFFNFPEDTKAVFRVIEKMQTAENIDDASNSLTYFPFHALTVVINKSYVSRMNTIGKTKKKGEKTFDNNVILFYDTDGKKPFEPKPFEKSKIIENLEVHLKNGYPLIFNELDYAGVPFGYVCFHFGNYGIINYARIPTLVTALRTSIGGFAAIQYQKQIVEQLDRTYQFDMLTGLYNRVGFSRKYKPLKEKLESNGGKLTVILSDLDRLKKINDLYGHSAGDNAILQTANSLKRACPQSALCVRFGGDEILAVIEGDADTDAIKEKIEKYLESYNAKSKLPYKIRSSIGTFKTDGKSDIDFETLIKGADKSLYTEKERHHAEHEDL